MYLHSVYIHWNIWLNELFYMINLHWGSLLPTQALNLPKVAKPPAKWCHSEEQRVRGHKLHAALLIWECSCDLYIKQADRTLSDFIWEFFGHGGRGAGTVYFFPNQQLQGTRIVVSSQTLVPRQIPICFHPLDVEHSGPAPAHSRLRGLIILSRDNEQDVLIYIGGALFHAPLCRAS